MMINKETAESYVLYGIKSTKFSKKMCVTFLPYYIFLGAIALAMYHDAAFIILVGIYMITSIVTSFLFRSKWNIITGFLSQATQMLLLAIVLDFMTFGFYQLFDSFAWYPYLISILTQVGAFIFSIILVINLSKKHDKKKKPVLNTSGGTVAVLFYALGSVFCQFFLQDASLSVVLRLIDTLINISIYLLSYIVVSACYRAYLVKKFKLEINLT